MTKQVKIVLSRDICISDYDDYYSRKIVQDSISDWEEISDEDYLFLRTNLFRLARDYQRDFDLLPTLLVKDDKPVIDRIVSIKEYIEQEKQQAAKEKAEADAKKREREKNRLLKKNKSEKELFEELKKKFEGK